MYTDNLHALIERYEAGLDSIYGEDRERFKWRALRTWQREWFRPEADFASFADRFAAASGDFGWLTDNSRVHPTAGVVKLWEKEPDTVERLFTETLFAPCGGDPDAAQRSMDAFLDGYEALRQRQAPANWTYKQDRHSASVYLAMREPDVHYIYKSTEAGKMARYIDFGLRIGSGAHFSLRNYYLLCETVISALKEHESLLEKHFSLLDDTCCADRSLHLLAFDLMYCGSAYHLYRDLALPPSRAPRAKRSSSGMTEEERARAEAEREEQIAALLKEIEETEDPADDCEDISLLGVTVQSDRYGPGTVVGQELEKIDVQFEGLRKTFVLDRKYPSRPRFEDDDAVVDAFTARSRRRERRRALEKRLNALRK